MMKKKFIITFILISIYIAGFLNNKAMAESSISWGIDNYKYVYSSKEEYAIEFKVSTENTGKLKNVSIKLPTNKTMILNNTFNFNRFDVKLKAEGLTKEEFLKKYPEGKYQIILSPKQFGSLTVNIIHDFPTTPDITDPANDKTGVSLTPEFKWNPLSGIASLTLYLYIKSKGSEEKEFKLSTTDTSLDLSSNPLQPNTEYELRLETKDTDGKGNDMITGRVINFTTGAE